VTDIPHKVVSMGQETVIDTVPGRQLGTVLLDFPEGAAICSDALSLTAITAEDANTLEKFMVVIGVAQFEQGRFGSLSPMTPDQARNFAASLIHGANQIDGGAYQ
jgi:hypothetical protein